MGGCERGVAAAALMPRRWGAPAQCLSPLAAGAGSLRGSVHLTAAVGAGKTAGALMQGGGGGGRSWGGVLRSGTVEALRVAAMILRTHQKSILLTVIQDVRRGQDDNLTAVLLTCRCQACRPPSFRGVLFSPEGVNPFKAARFTVHL